MKSRDRDEHIYIYLQDMRAFPIPPSSLLSILKLTRVSSEYLKSGVLLSLTSMAGQTSRVLLAYVILCTNKAS